LDLIDFLVDQGNILIHTNISSKDFMSFLVNILKEKKIPEVQVKVLYLIKKWGTKFEYYKEKLPNFNEIYISFMNSGVKFPDNIQ
jgi:hypothetical protein